MRRMFDDLMLPWETVGPREWMYAIPRAAPRAIADLVSQFNGVLPAPLFPVIKKKDKLNVEVYGNYAFGSVRHLSSY